MNSEERMTQRFGEITEDYEGDLEYPEEAFDQTVREVVSEEYRDLPSEELEELVIEALEDMPPMVIEGFFSFIKKIGKKIVKGVKKVLPFVSKAAPFLSGIPVVGPYIGGAANMLQKLLGRRRRRRAVKRRKRPTSAAAKLIGLLNRPELLKVLLGQLLGRSGRKSVTVGKKRTAVPGGALMNLLGTLANQAAVEMNASGTGSQETPQYLLGEEGELLCDPAVPEERANVLWNLLEEADEEEDVLYEYDENDERYAGDVTGFTAPEDYYMEEDDYPEDEFEGIDDDEEDFYEEMDTMDMEEAYALEEDDDEPED